MSLRMELKLDEDLVVRSLWLSWMVPEVWKRSGCVSALKVVVLPAPFTPKSAKLSP